MKSFYSLLVCVIVLVIGLEALSKKFSSRKPGRCPQGNSIFDSGKKGCAFESLNCSTDKDCPKNEKCCGCPKNCRAAIKVTKKKTNKPGKKLRNPSGGGRRSCPIKVIKPLPDFCKRVTIINECSKDSNCSPDEICCTASTCGGNQCTSRGGSIGGRRCPKVGKNKPAICRTVRVGNMCKMGQQCPKKDEVCCKGKCGGTACVKKGGKGPAHLG